jgi:hypothetical protein
VIPKRTFWTTVGYGAGVASTFYVKRRVRRALGPTGADAVQKVRSTAGGVRSSARGVRVAVSEGRAAMRETERELRQEYQPRR